MPDDSPAYGFSEQDAKRVAGATRTTERLYKGGELGLPGIEPRYAGLFQKFLTTSIITAGVAVAGAMPTPGFGTVNMWTGIDPQHQVVGTGTQLGLKIYNDGLQSVPSGTVVYGIWMGGGWYIFWCLCP
jgi:hypothetical protein